MFRPANPDLKPERLWSYELAFSQQMQDGRLSYGVNVFYIDGGNLIMRVPVDGRPMNVNTGRIRNAGAEVQAAYRIGAAWTVDANYSYLHMEQPVLAAPEHKLYAGALFTHGRWDVSTGVQYVAGLYTEVKVAGSTGRRISCCGTCELRSVRRSGFRFGYAARTCWHSGTRYWPVSQCPVLRSWPV